jgi:hypothetical protein
MDIEEFYDGDPRRRASDETELGTEWTTADGGRAEISWIHDTGEVYSMAEPVEPIGSDGIGDLYVQSLPTDALTVEILGVITTREDLDAKLAGWETAMAQPNSVEWVKSKLA